MIKFRLSKFRIKKIIVIFFQQQVLVTDQDIRRQESKVQEARKKLEQAMKTVRIMET